VAVYPLKIRVPGYAHIFAVARKGIRPSEFQIQRLRNEILDQYKETKTDESLEIT